MSELLFQLALAAEKERVAKARPAAQKNRSVVRPNYKISTFFLMNLNLKAKDKNTYDAIVVGSGISGGWAAKELTQKGLKVLLLERGKDIKHVEDYKNAMKAPWELDHANLLTQEIKTKFPIQTAEGNYPINEANQDFWLPEDVSPYISKKPFAPLDSNFLMNLVLYKKPNRQLDLIF